MRRLINHSVKYLGILDIVHSKYFLNGWPVKSAIAVSTHQFCIAGEWMVMSTLQGGPAPNFFYPTVYSYISRNSLDPNKNKDSLNKEIANKVTIRIRLCTN